MITLIFNRFSNTQLEDMCERSIKSRNPASDQNIVKNQIFKMLLKLVKDQSHRAKENLIFCLQLFDSLSILLILLQENSVIGKHMKH